MTEFAYQLMDTNNQEANIKVIGIGGGGGNAVSHMVTKGIKGVEFICANTDTQDLRMTKADIQLQIGINETKGLGSGIKPEIGRASAEEDRERIASVIDGSDMLFIAAGLGGGTGTGACPVVAEIAQEKGILTVAVVNTPFSWEGEKRKENAMKLSGGQRRRVEIARTLCTKPNFILLDEPFTGIDPLQLNEVKNLIKNSLVPIYQQMPYDPRDITVLSHPVDFVVFDGANKVRMKEQDFVKEVVLLTKKTNNAYSQKLHKSIHDVIQNKEYEWKTAKVLDGNIDKFLEKSLTL